MANLNELLYTRQKINKENYTQSEHDIQKLYLFPQ